MTNATEEKNTAREKALIESGAHFGYTRPRRHPSIKPYLAGSKNRVDIIEVDKIAETLEKAKEFVAELGKSGKIMLFVGSKPEARETVMNAALGLDMPYVTERWLGGTLTNFSEIKKRIDRLNDLIEKRTKGETKVYTKKEQLLIDREIARLEKYFRGLSQMKNLPAAIFVADSKKEEIAVEEAIKMKIPVVSISNSDCDISRVSYPIVGNDASVSSIIFFVSEIVSAYQSGREVSDK